MLHEIYTNINISFAVTIESCINKETEMCSMNLYKLLSGGIIKFSRKRGNS